MLQTAGSSSAVWVVIQCGVLHQSSKDKEEADGHKQVHGSDIRHSGEWRPGHTTEGGHSEHCGYTWRAQDGVWNPLVTCQNGAPQVLFCFVFSLLKMSCCKFEAWKQRPDVKHCFSCWFFWGQSSPNLLSTVELELTLLSKTQNKTQWKLHRDDSHLFVWPSHLAWD